VPIDVKIFFDKAEASPVSFFDAGLIIVVAAVAFYEM